MNVCEWDSDVLGQSCGNLQYFPDECGACGVADAAPCGDGYCSFGALCQQPTNVCYHEYVQCESDDEFVAPTDESICPPHCPQWDWDI